MCKAGTNFTKILSVFLIFLNLWFYRFYNLITGTQIIFRILIISISSLSLSSFAICGLMIVAEVKDSTTFSPTLGREIS